MLPTQPAWERWLPGRRPRARGLLFAWSAYGRGFWQFVLDSRVELRKIVWPNRQETWHDHLVVFVFVIVAGMFFWLLDLAARLGDPSLTGQGS